MQSKRGWYRLLAMRDLDQIIEAHDLIVSFLLDVPDAIADEAGLDAMSCLVHSADVLCWLLNHSHNERFAKKLAALRELLLADADSIPQTSYTN